MALNKEQIDYLFAFTQMKYVRWYDVQVELVDHLASAIEEKMEADPNLIFEKALENVYAGFDIHGFSKLVRAKEKAMRKSYRKAKWKAILNQFRWPFILRSLAVLAVLLVVSQFLKYKTISIIAIILGFAYIIYEMIQFSKELEVSKRLLMLQKIPGEFSGAVVFPLFLFNVDGLFSSEPLARILITSAQQMSFTIVMWAFVIIEIAIITVRKSYITKAREMYPAVFAES